MNRVPIKKYPLVSLFALLVSASAYSQSLTIHNAPQGKTTYASSAEWPGISGQCHWVPGDGSPALDPPDTLTHDMAHTHAEFDAVPIWAELGNQQVTVPITIQLFHTAGSVNIITGVYGGSLAYAYYIPVVMDTPGPYVGDPNGLVKYHGHMTFNLADGLKAGAPMVAHGWTGIMLFTRTGYADGDQVDNETSIPLYSTVDLTQPEAPLTEAGIELAEKCVDTVSHAMNEGSIFGIHLTEFRDQLLPILAPFSSPLTTKAFGYNYGFDAGLPQDFPSVVHGTYTMLVDNDFHMGAPGVVNVPATVSDGNIGNFDTLDPLWISQQTPPMGFAAGKHRLTFQWAVRTPDGGWTDQYGLPEPGGLELRSLLSVTVATGPNPIGCTAALCPPIPVVTPPPIVSTPPPATTPPPTTTPPATTTPSSVWITVGTANKHDLQQLMSDPTTPLVPLEFRVCQSGDTNCSGAEIDR